MCLPWNVTPAWARALSSAGWSWVDLAGEVSGPGLLGRAVAPRTTRQLSARFSVLRQFVLSPAMTQIELAAATGVTQGRVAQILANATAGDTGREQRVRWWLENYPGAGGVHLELFASGELRNQLSELNRLCPDLVVSGAEAAEQLAAWALPRRTTAYAPTLPSLRELQSRGFVEVDDPRRSTISLHTPADTSLFATATATPTTTMARGRPLPRVADPLQVWSDLADDLGDAQRTLVDARDRILSLLRSPATLA